MLASTPGWRLATLSTSGPSITRRVTSASAVSTVHASGTPGPVSSSGSRRWSHVHRPSKPAPSAASAAARMSAQRALMGISSRSVFMASRRASWRAGNREYHSSMVSSILIGTDTGLWELTKDGALPVDALAGHAITALARDGGRTWAVIDGTALWVREAAWTRRAAIDGPAATCVAPTPTGLLVGTEQGH